MPFIWTFPEKTQDFNEIVYFQKTIGVFVASSNHGNLA